MKKIFVFTLLFIFLSSLNQQIVCMETKSKTENPCLPYDCFANIFEFLDLGDRENKKIIFINFLSTHKGAPHSVAKFLERITLRLKPFCTIDYNTWVFASLKNFLEKYYKNGTGKAIDLDTKSCFNENSLLSLSATHILIIASGNKVESLKYRFRYNVSDKAKRKEVEELDLKIKEFGKELMKNISKCESLRTLKICLGKPLFFNIDRLSKLQKIEKLGFDHPPVMYNKYESYFDSIKKLTDGYKNLNCITVFPTEKCFSRKEFSSDFALNLAPNNKSKVLKIKIPQYGYDEDIKNVDHVLEKISESFVNSKECSFEELVIMLPFHILSIRTQHPRNTFFYDETISIDSEKIKCIAKIVPLKFELIFKVDGEDRSAVTYFSDNFFSKLSMEFSKESPIKYSQASLWLYAGKDFDDYEEKTLRGSIKFYTPKI